MKAKLINIHFCTDSKGKGHVRPYESYLCSNHRRGVSTVFDLIIPEDEFEATKVRLIAEHENVSAIPKGDA